MILYFLTTFNDNYTFVPYSLLYNHIRDKLLWSSKVYSYRQKLNAILKDDNNKKPMIGKQLKNIKTE